MHCSVWCSLSYKLKEEAKLSQDLIILLSIGNVPASFFLGLVDKALESLRSFFFTRGQVFKGTHTSVLAQQCHQGYFLLFSCKVVMFTHTFLQNLNLILGSSGKSSTMF